MHLRHSNNQSDGHEPTFTPITIATISLAYHSIIVLTDKIVPEQGRLAEAVHGTNDAVNSQARVLILSWANLECYLQAQADMPCVG